MIYTKIKLKRCELRLEIYIYVWHKAKTRARTLYSTKSGHHKTGKANTVEKIRQAEMA